MLKKIGKYEIIEELGHGGQAQMYKAEDMSLPGRLVALKTTILADNSKSRMDYLRLKREAQVLGLLNHPQIAQLFEFGEDTKIKIAYMARQYLEGNTLAEHL
ncbi:serine/threonine protein kinase, partial [bacterium]|nr:serine/threonine protein kinase [bacterium]MBU1026037.1 serine/threonine protein kinase [bacterium]